MAQEKNFIVLGLGRFGTTLSNLLADQGYNVIAIDKDIDAVEGVSKTVQAFRGDFTAIETLRMVGADECEVGIVSTGSSLEDTIMGVMNLKEMGVKTVISKAKDERCASVIMKVGADKIIQPEKDVAKRLSKMLMADNIVDLVDIDDSYSIADIECPKSWFGKSLKELNLRNKYDMNVIGFKLTADAKMYANIGPDYVVKENEYVVAVVNKDAIAQIAKLK